MSAASGNIFDVFKAQILFNQGDNMIYGLLIMTLFEFTTGILKEFFVLIKNYANEWIKRKFTNTVQDKILDKMDDKSAELQFERNYSRNDNWDCADAILSHILKVPATQTVLVVGQVEVVKNRKEFPVNDSISFQLIDIQADKDGTLKHLAFRIFSRELTICELREFVDNLVEDYLITKKNNLGNKCYYFDQIIEKPKPRMPPPKKILFSRHLFETNRNLDNVFHERQEEVKGRVNNFLTNKDWYDQRGVPYTLGLMLHGAPGTGKTSTIKAIANATKRHIININFNAIKTQKQLKKLFYDERIEVCENMENTNATTEYIIPIDKRMYVIEDFDAVENDILSRRSKSSITKIQDDEEDITDLDLKTILNIIEGTLETPGRIMIITSNYPEKLDDALIRPGRIDMLIEYKKCNEQVLHDMYVSFFEEEPDPTVLSQIQEYKWTPAEVSQILFKNMGQPKSALDDLLHLDPIQYFHFNHEEPEKYSLIQDTPIEEPPVTPPNTPFEDPMDASVEEPAEEPNVRIIEQQELDNIKDGSDLLKRLQEERNNFIQDLNENVAKSMSTINDYDVGDYELLNGYAQDNSGYNGLYGNSGYAMANL